MDARIVLNKIGIFTLAAEVLVVDRLLLCGLEENGFAAGRAMIKRQGD